MSTQCEEAGSGCAGSVVSTHACVRRQEVESIQCKEGGEHTRVFDEAGSGCAGSGVEHTRVCEEAGSG